MPEDNDLIDILTNEGDDTWGDDTTDADQQAREELESVGIYLG